MCWNRIASSWIEVRFEDVSEDVRQRLEFIFLDQVDDLIANGLEAEPARQPESAQAA